MLSVPMMSGKDPKEQSQIIDLPMHEPVKKGDTVMKEESKNT
jgi:hypothetical protein